MVPYANVLCALDFAPGSERALVRAADLAERAHATLHLVHIQPPSRAGLAYDRDPDTAFHTRVRDLVGAALGTDDAFEVVAPVVHQASSPSPATGVLDYAAAIEADLIVVGTHGRSGLRHLILGSVAAETLRRSRVPVLVVPDGAERTAPGPAGPVLLGVDFSEHTRSALSAALAFGKAFGAPLAVAHVRDGPLNGDSIAGRKPAASPADLTSQPDAHDALDALLEGVGIASHAETHVVHGPPVEALVDLARRTSAGLVVVGTHGRSGWDRLRLGSVAEGVARRASCPVLAVPLPTRSA